LAINDNVKHISPCY